CNNCSGDSSKPTIIVATARVLESMGVDYIDESEVL
ncbi:hypothetical protein SS7213T_03475, partial [Staphylococcus simiae CCM 7213 = CCUG 51256]